MRIGRRRDPWWSSFALDGRSYQVTDNVRFVTSKRRRGVVVIWTIDNEGDALAAHLTDRETSRVLRAMPNTVGLLEPVRSRLRHREAILLTGKEGAAPFEIPAGGSEKEFVRQMFGAVDAASRVEQNSRIDTEIVETLRNDDLVSPPRLAFGH